MSNKKTSVSNYLGEALSDHVKTDDEYFRDWESDAFGYGYGDGEEHIIPVLKKFVETLPEPGQGGYDYQKLEAEFTPVIAWMMINVLCKNDIIDYGTSPRYGFLSEAGARMKAYFLSKTVEELHKAMNGEEGYFGCYRTTCNCGPNGHQADVMCRNPFWFRREVHEPKAG